MIRLKVNKNLSKFDKFLLTFVFYGVILRKNTRRMIMKDGLTRFTKIILDIMYFSGIGVTATLPISIKFLGKYIPFYETYYYQQLIIFFIAAFIASSVSFFIFSYVLLKFINLRVSSSFLSFKSL